MPRHGFSSLDGRLVDSWIESPFLRGNLLGDPSRRLTRVYVPPGGGTSLPLIVYLASFTNSGVGMTGWKAFGESIPERVERLIREGRMEPTVVAFPDCFTSMGGNQYVNSPVTGDWERFLTDSLVPHLIDRYPVSSRPQRRAVAGFSSGGYGALIQGMRHSRHWGAVACHSGDMGFELLFPPEFPRVATVLQDFDHDPERFLESFRESPRVDGPQWQTMLILAMAASYDPNPTPGGGIRLPFDLQTCERVEARWRNWLRHDPLHIVGRPETLQNLQRLGGLYLDCGNRDQYHLHFGARRFSRSLEQHEIDHRFEEFEGTHSGVQDRLDVSLPFLAECLRSE